ncbi:(2Fe-2S)-binding protein [Sphingomonas sabuli]|uniref:Bacterioferritin-associated ferredoxin n=1 Tax=Sphingomonas sabuli TaxID=2764186 RepID=A0A7G9L1L6_9SPHN|nr:(2Fe-2S)-binding protein [Sphingomonas sabuli]QNM82515.1 (2Fe-2S)-binding protein [Sphingomonas sabuli]
MILCVCNAITEREVRDLARAGARTPEEAYAALGHEPQCGSCLCYADRLMAEERSRRPAPKLRIVA